MPINFESAAPLDVAAASAYGANQSFQQALPAIAGLYAAAGRTNSEAQQHAADRNARGQEAIAGLSLRANEFHDQQAQQAQRDVYESTRGFEMQQQRAELASWLNGQELSQKEQVRLQAMTNGVADVLANADLSGEEKQNLVMKLKTGIDVYRTRQEKARAQQEEALAQQALASAKRQTEIANGNATLSAKGLPGRTENVYDKGELTRIRRDHPDWTPAQVQEEADLRGAYTTIIHKGVDQYGNIHDEVLKGHGRQRDAVGGKAEKPVTRFGDEHGVFSYKNALPEAKAEAEAAFPVDKQASPSGTGTVDANAGKRAEYMQKVLDRMRAEHGTAHGGTKPASEAPSGAKPFGPDEAASPDQLHQVNELSRQRDVVEKLPIPPGLKSQFTAATYVMDAMLRKYGTLSQSAYDRMDDEDKKNYAWARKSIDQIQNVRFQGQPAAQPAARPWYDRYQPAAGGGGGY